MSTSTIIEPATGELGTRTAPLTLARQVAQAYLRRAGVSRVNDVTDVDRVGIPVYTSVRPFAADGLNTMTSGKGLTHEAAWVSAAMEAIERSFCEPGPADEHGTYRDLAGANAVLDPRRLNLRRGHRWTPDTPLEWCRVTELASGADVLVPAAAVYTPYPDPLDMMTSSTVGLASGATTTDALLHAVLEIVEHDATAFGETARVGAQLDPATVPDRVAELMGRFTRVGIAVKLFHFPGRAGIPTCYATISDEASADPLLINGGAGCDLDAETAALRALCEAAQSRLIVIAGSREDLDQEAYRRHVSFRAARERLARWAADWPVEPFGAVPSIRLAGAGDELAEVLRRVRAAGLGPVLARVMCRPGDPVSVVRAVVPGAEFTHLDRRRCGPAMAAALTGATGQAGATTPAGTRS